MHELREDHHELHRLTPREAQVLLLLLPAVVPRWHGGLMQPCLTAQCSGQPDAAVSYGAMLQAMHMAYEYCEYCSYYENYQYSW